jgi:pimeloyl-ACP methyl ester carboxylesterase
VVRRQTRITSANGVESLEKIRLGGVDQWISVRGWNKSNPVMLFLHGGPGAGDIITARNTDIALARHFVVVRWDQRGAGKSYSSKIPIDSMNIEQFVSDTIELVERLRDRFNVSRIYLVGHSWGSELGILAVDRHPEYFHSFVGIGQLVDVRENEIISYQFALDKAAESGNQKALRKLKKIGPPPHDYKKLLIQRKWLEKFGGVHHKKEISFAYFCRIGAVSPDITLYDGFRYLRGQYFSLEHMWEKELYRINLFTSVPKIDVPIYFFLGRYDYNTPSEIVERYCEQLQAPKGKTVIWFENSAHIIPHEEPELFCDMLVNKVLKETYSAPHRDS